MGMFARLRARRLTPDEAAADAGLMIVDVRSPDEYRAGHAPTAVNLPLGTLEQRLGGLETHGRSVAFICHSGTRSAMAVRAARRAGVDARNIAGGMLAWRRAGLPVETGKRR